MMSCLLGVRSASLYRMQARGVIIWLFLACLLN
jgi:hypothetical protein